MNRNKPMTNEELQEVAPSAFAGQAYHNRSERYAFIPTIEVIDAMRAHGYLPFSASQSRTRVEGKELFTKHMIRFQSADSGLTTVGDSRMEMVLINSHDGTSAYKLMLGVFRLVCSNGMVVSESLAESINIRHTGRIVDQVLNGTDSLIQAAPKLTVTMNQWRQILLNTDEARVFAEQAITLRYEQNSPVTVDQVLESRRPEDSQNSLWHVFNRVQESLIRGGLRYRRPVLNEAGEQMRNYYGRLITRRQQTRPVNGIDQNTNLNKALWALAEGMAKLKK